MLDYPHLKKISAGDFIDLIDCIIILTRSTQKEVKQMAAIKDKKAVISLLGFWRDAHHECYVPVLYGSTLVQCRLYEYIVLQLYESICPAGKIREGP